MTPREIFDDEKNKHVSFNHFIPRRLETSQAERWKDDAPAYRALIIKMAQYQVSRSEDEVGEKVDRCVTDSLVKTG